MMFPPIGTWVDGNGDRPLVAQLFEARSFLQRAMGLQFRRDWDANNGLLIKNCRAIHTMWMRFPLDIYFLDEELRIVECHLAIAPWKVLRSMESSSKHTVELPAGPYRDIKVDTCTRIVSMTSREDVA